MVKAPGDALAVVGKKTHPGGREPPGTRWPNAHIRRPRGEETQDERQKRLLPHRDGRIERVQGSLDMATMGKRGG